MEVNLLSNDDMEILRRFLRTQANRNNGNLSDPGNPQVRQYIVRNQLIADIPPLVGDTPGSAVCELFFVAQSGDLEKVLLPDGNPVLLTAYNASKIALPYGFYEVIKSAFGKWHFPNRCGMPALEEYIGWICPQQGTGVYRIGRNLVSPVTWDFHDTTGSVATLDRRDFNYDDETFYSASDNKLKSWELSEIKIGNNAAVELGTDALATTDMQGVAQGTAGGFVDVVHQDGKIYILAKNDALVGRRWCIYSFPIAGPYTGTKEATITTMSGLTNNPNFVIDHRNNNAYVSGFGTNQQGLYKVPLGGGVDVKVYSTNLGSFSLQSSLLRKDYVGSSVFDYIHMDGDSLTGHGRYIESTGAFQPLTAPSIYGGFSFQDTRYVYPSSSTTELLTRTYLWGTESVLHANLDGVPPLSVSPTVRTQWILGEGFEHFGDVETAL